MEFLSDHWGKLLIVVVIVLAWRAFCKPNWNIDEGQVAENMASTQRLIEFLKICSDEEALDRWAEVQRYVSCLSPSEHHELEWTLARVNRGEGAAGRLVSWVKQESALRYDMA